MYSGYLIFTEFALIAKNIGGTTCYNYLFYVDLLRVAQIFDCSLHLRVLKYA